MREKVHTGQTLAELKKKTTSNFNKQTNHRPTNIDTKLKSQTHSTYVKQMAHQATMETGRQCGERRARRRAEFVHFVTVVVVVVLARGQHGRPLALRAVERVCVEQRKQIARQVVDTIEERARKRTQPLEPSVTRGTIVECHAVTFKDGILLRVKQVNIRQIETFESQAVRRDRGQNLL
jgi:hypothetical protein